MELSFKSIKKREVINVVDASSMGYPTDVLFSFPRGVFKGIYVQGAGRRGIFKLFSKSTIFIDQSKIIRIGGDVILVNLRCGDVCEDSVSNHPSRPDRPNVPNNFAPSSNPCPPPCPPRDNCCPPPCHTQKRPNAEELFYDISTERIDRGDY